MSTTQTIAHVQYDNHVKEALRSGKPVELSLKDFIHTSAKKPIRKVIAKSRIETELWLIWKANQKDYAGLDNGMLRLSLFKSHTMKMMSEAESLEDVREIYSTSQSISYNNQA